MPKASFILPAYKRRFLKESVDSILAQTCRDFELVIVDDKSPEGLYEVIKEYKWEPTFEALPDGGRKWLVDGIPVRYYQNAENIGGKDLVAAWNHAMEYATGEWSVLASDDDRYLPHFLEEMIGLSVKYPKCDLVHCRAAGINEIGEWIRVGEQRVEYETQIQHVYARGVDRIFEHMPDFMFRSAALKLIGGFVSFPIAWYSDDATWMMLARNGVVCSPKVLFEFRTSGINLSARIDNIAPKIVAGEEFRSWFKEFCTLLKASTKEEQYLLEGILLKVNTKINGLSFSELSQVRCFINWFKLLNTMDLTGKERLKALGYRYPRMLSFYRLLPKIHPN